MDFLEALAWAEEHNALLRFNGNREVEGRSFRVTISGVKEADRIVNVCRVAEDANLTTMMAAAISEVREEFEALARRRYLRLVAVRESGDDQELPNDRSQTRGPARWQNLE